MNIDKESNCTRRLFRFSEKNLLQIKTNCRFLQQCINIATFSQMELNLSHATLSTISSFPAQDIRGFPQLTASLLPHVMVCVGKLCHYVTRNAIIERYQVGIIVTDDLRKHLSLI
ncbi:hypothetical protein TNIN_134511 [Trichonephila inaurata madagascariensis]|uniref:Uncharacterized protein n=1 Tax=Trichonephila inaurata madagascariensis TaxID=2747483 RepID=A0A8X6WLU6_9ARAC|nr:hypothetical protein TNIN_134511 [Trichonephila inaurata madagascariensis]